MKNKIYIVALFLIFGIAATSCKKETGPVTKTETPTKATIDAGLVLDSIGIQYGGTLEFGNKIYFSKNGKITKLGCKMASLGNFRVSLWDSNTQNLIVATTIDVTDTTKFIYNTISPVDVTANTRYVISMNNCISGIGKKLYLFYKKGTLSGSIYPYTTGSVTFEDIRFISSKTSAFPITVNLSQYINAGITDFQFEYTE